MWSHRPRSRRVASGLLGLVSLVASVASGDTVTADAPVATPPDGRVGTIAGPLTGGGGINLAAARSPELNGWIRDEYTIEGDAVRYTADGELAPDGAWTLNEGDAAPYRTRIVVVRPEDPVQFNGTVVLEWLNVTSGFDSPADFAYLGDELIRGGTVWVGVSAQRIGIEGGCGGRVDALERGDRRRARHQGDRPGAVRTSEPPG